ncbi:HRDC domain-containing protein [Kribbia dieselivorans]|uniref:HRDC domain-containing protein n=1 Tax=Kribbia dieselivorans TaxID=331526 RepID=UPI0008397CE0|nr:HRDC domain-containing protein [Kribbia dieselivorans]
MARRSETVRSTSTPGPSDASPATEESLEAFPADPPPKPQLPVLSEPADGVPPVLTDERQLAECVAAVAAGFGPISLDAERASGYRYGQRAYLVQLRREGAGTFLIDPIALPDLTPLNEAIGHAEWLLHAATQDIPCLAEVGLRPKQLFDTELAGRLLGLPRVGLAAVVEHYLGVTLAKEHSAVDWSTRPLPEPWLRYAALDVEVLVELRNLMGIDLARAGKSEWAREEFDALLDWMPTPKTEPWRRTSGLHRFKNKRDVARVRELWYAREDIAKEKDVSPGRIMPDQAIVEIAAADPRSAADLPSGHRAIHKHAGVWLKAVAIARDLPDDQLPAVSVRHDGPPQQRSWADKDPVAAARLMQTRERMAAFCEEHSLPIENLCSPDPLRRVVWTPPAEQTEEGFTLALRRHGVRPWQAGIVAPMLVEAFSAIPR